MKYFKSEAEKQADKKIKNPAIKKARQQWRRDFVRSAKNFDSSKLIGCVASFTKEQQANNYKKYGVLL